MKITIEIDTRDMDDHDRSILSLLSGGASLPLAIAASGAEQGSDMSAGATTATQTTNEPARRGRGAAKKTEAAASTPASGTSPGDVFSTPAGSAPTGATSGAALTGDVFSQQVRDANAAAAAGAGAAAAAAGGVTKEQVSARVSELLPTLGAKGLRDVLSKFVKEDGQAVQNLRDLQAGDFAAFLEELSVYG